MIRADSQAVVRRIAEGSCACGPSKPAPSPSKPSSRGAAGRVPWERCSTAMPAGLKVGGGIGGGMTSSGPFSCSVSGSSSKGSADVPHPAPSQTATAVPSADPLSDVSGRETSYLMALCTSTAPTRGFPSWLWLARDCSSAPLAKTRNETPIPIALVTPDLNARPMDTLRLRYRGNVNNYKVYKLSQQRVLEVGAEGKASGALLSHFRGRKGGVCAPPCLKSRARLF